MGSCPSEIVERALVESKDFNRVLGKQSPDALVLKVVGKEEYFLEQKPISCYKVGLFSVFVFQVPHMLNTC